MERRIDPQFAPIIHFFENGIPFNGYLGMKVIALAAGEAIIHIPMRDELIGNPFLPAIHGGVTATLIDTTGGAACFASFDDMSHSASTVDLRIDYLRPGPPGTLACHAKVIRMGNRVATVRMAVFPEAVPQPGTPEHDKPIAIGQGVYNIVRPGGDAPTS